MVEEDDSIYHHRWWRPQRPVSVKKEDSAASVVKSDALDSSVNTLGLLSTSIKVATNERPPPSC